jgi:hypothetical protein
MDGELKLVAKGTLIQPESRTMHKNPMDDVVMKVKLARVLSGCDDIDPPYKLQGAEEHKTLGGCHNWPMTWPKAQILFVGGGCTIDATSILRPRPQAPTVVATTSRHQKLLGACVPPHGKVVAPPLPSSPPPHEDVDMAPHNGNNAADDDEEVDVDAFLNTGASNGPYMPVVDVDPPSCAHDYQAARPSTCLQHLIFRGFSQETPLVANPPSKPGFFFSPTILRNMICSEQIAPHVEDSMEDPATMKPRKRSKNKQ